MNTAQTLDVGFHRKHPKSRFLDEEVVLKQQAAGAFAFSHTLSQARSTFAVWIQCDGDDTASDYDVELKALNLEVD